MADQVRITEDTTGSPDGVRVEEYEVGETLACGSRRMTRRLAQILVDDGTAEWTSSADEGAEEDNVETVGPSETKPDGPSETKPASPEDRAFEGGSYETNGSWKAFYDGDGWEVGNAQCSEEEAESWVDGEVSLSDLKD